MTSFTNPRDVPIEAMRELARDHAERSSLRHLAPEIGLGHSTLHNFLNGATPHPRVRRLLGIWYLRMMSGEGGAAESVETYASALKILLGDLPAPSRERAAGEVLDVVERGYEKAGKTPPEWLDALRESSTERD